MPLYALIRNGIVEKVIVAEADFITLISAEWDACVRVEGREDRPSPSWTYDGELFTPPEEAP
jgi:hypothetical protein